jgi:serine/threonine-protein kinase
MREPDDTESLSTGDTQNLRPARRDSVRGSRTTGTPVRTPLEALKLAEIGQVRLLAVFVLVLAIVVYLGLPLLDGNPTAKNLHRWGLMLGATSAGWVVWRLRDPASYRPWVSTLFGACGSLAVVSALLYWGAYSVAIVVVPIGIYMFAAGESVNGAYLIFLVCVLPHLIMCVLLSVGILAPFGLIDPQGLPPRVQIVALIYVQFIFAAAFILARRVRRTTLGVIAQLEQAVREIAQREALLDEAKRELDRALRVGGPGRFTDQEVGSFRLGNLLGRGAMGEVYEASHVSTDAKAAVKLLTHAAGTDPSLVERFFREVKIAASLQSPNVVRVLEVPSEDAAVPYLAMERLVGETLSELLRQSPLLSPTEVVEIIRQVGNGVSAAHAAGIVHRDLKPSNVFQHRPDAQTKIWKVVDFGVSKLADTAGTLTQGKLIGTPDFMAPEQARGETVDLRADVHALGVIAYRALTGRPAFRGNDVPSVLFAVTQHMPPRPSTLAKIPSAFDHVLIIALAKDPALRFQSATELSEALAAAREDVVTPEISERAARALRAHPWGI